MVLWQCALNGNFNTREGVSPVPLANGKQKTGLSNKGVNLFQDDSTSQGAN